jgi:hypothetical protein
MFKKINAGKKMVLANVEYKKNDPIQAKKGLRPSLSR